MSYTEGQVEKAITAIGIDIHDELSDDFLVFCPYHFNTRTAAAEVSKEHGTFYCFSCNVSASLVSLVMFVTKRSYFESMRLIDSKAREENVQASIAKTLEVVKQEPFNEQLLQKLHSELVNSPRAISYLEGRGIADGIEEFNLGYSKNTDMVTVPVHSPDGMPLGFVARSIEGKDFKNSSGLKKSKTLFNLHRVRFKSSITVVESSFDAIKLSLAGIPAVATLGSAVSKSQLELLKLNFNHVIIVPDADEAGEKMQKRLSDVMGKSLTIVALPPNVKDVGDLTANQIKKLSEYVDNPIAALL